MGKSNIEWTDYSWNPWQGCTKVSAGCKNCYMYRDKKRYGQDPSVVVRSAPATFNAPLAKNRDGSWKIPSGSKVFVCSWSDFYHEAADPWRDGAWAVMAQRKDLTFILVTKRPERMAHHMPFGWDGPFSWFERPWPNVWLLVSVESQETANERLPDFLKIPALVRGVSMEPLIGPVDLTRIIVGNSHYIDSLRGTAWDDENGELSTRLNGEVPIIHGLDWVIVGGESGTKSQDVRPMHPDWVRTVRDQCVAAGVPFFFKQWGDWAPRASAGTWTSAVTKNYPERGVAMLGDGRIALEELPESEQLKRNKEAGRTMPGAIIRDRTALNAFHLYCNSEGRDPGYQWMFRVGKRSAGRMLDGREWNEFPKAVGQ